MKTDWNKLIKKFDKQGALKHLRSFPRQLIEATLLASRIALKKKKFSNIVVCGMGASGIGGMVAKNLLKKEVKIPLETVSDYELPAFVDKNSLVLAVSYSGNTEETVACFKEAKHRKASVISISSNGLLAKLDKKCVLVPKGLPQPRLGFTYLFATILVALSKLGLIERKEKELNRAVHALEKNRHRIETEAMRLALAMHGKIPAIYTENELSAIAYRFCTELNENAKQACHFHVFPEMNHNEINAEHGASQIAIMLLRDKSERKRIAQRIEISKKIWKKRFKIVESFVEGDSLLSRTLFAVWLESLASYYLALLNGEDPLDNATIPVIKKALREKKV